MSISRLLLDNRAGRPWPVALALPGQAARALGVVIAPSFDDAVRAVWARWPLLPVGSVTVDGVALPDATDKPAPLVSASRQTARQTPEPLTEGQRRYWDRLRVHRSGRQSAAQRDRRDRQSTTPRLA